MVYTNKGSFSLDETMTYDSLKCYISTLIAKKHNIAFGEVEKKVYKKHTEAVVSAALGCIPFKPTPL